MHMLGAGTMQNNPTYDDVASEVNGYLLLKARELVERGHSMDKIHLDQNRIWKNIRAQYFIA